MDVAANWSVFKSSGGRPTQYKFGVNVIDRERDFSSRRFRFIPNVATSGGSIGLDLSQAPELLYTEQNIGPRWRFNEETRPVDAYNGTYTTLAAYGMVDIALSTQSRLIAGLRVEDFDQEVVTFDPFGLFERTHDGGEQEHRPLPVDQLGAVGGGEPEHPAGLQQHREPSGVPRAGAVRVHGRRRGSLRAG